MYIRGGDFILLDHIKLLLIFINLNYRAMESIFLVCIGMLIFIGGSLLLKSNKSKSDHIIIAWSVLAILSQLGFYYVATGNYAMNVRFSQFVFGTLLLHAPMLYFYVQAQLDPNFTFNVKNLLHLTPLFIFYLLHIPEFSQNVGMSVCSSHFGCYLSNKPCSVVYNFSKLILNTFYLMLTFFTYRDLYKPENKRKGHEKIDFLWIKILLYVTFSLNIFIIIYRLLEVGQIHIFPANLFLMNIVISAYIIVFSFIGSNFTGILDFLKLVNKLLIYIDIKMSYYLKKEQAEDELIPELDDCQNAFGLCEDTLEKYLVMLKKYILEEKPFLDQHLSRAKLAGLIKIPSHHLAYVIKIKYNQTFTDFINSYRLELLLEKLDEPKYKNFTLLALAFECGFNSKSTFNRCFKTHLGKTPTEFLKLKHENVEMKLAG